MCRITKLIMWHDMCCLKQIHLTVRCKTAGCIELWISSSCMSTHPSLLNSYTCDRSPGRSLPKLVSCGSVWIHKRCSSMKGAHKDWESGHTWPDSPTPTHTGAQMQAYSLMALLVGYGKQMHLQKLSQAVCLLVSRNSTNTTGRLHVKHDVLLEHGLILCLFLLLPSHYSHNNVPLLLGEVTEVRWIGHGALRCGWARAAAGPHRGGHNLPLYDRCTIPAL